MRYWQRLVKAGDKGIRGTMKTADSEEIEGTVYSVVFHNEENGFTIFQAQSQQQLDLVTVLGILPSVAEGESFKARGQWQNDRKFGRQFKADHIQPAPPENEKAIELFLGSGLIDGIGKNYAKRIVAKFGKDTFDVIENESQRLESIEGVGKKRRQLIKESWIKQKSVRDIMFFLHGCGLSTARAHRLYKVYGEKAVHVLRQNPYQLARDMPGVGFKTADDIARKMGKPEDSPQRIEAAIRYIIESAGDNGHCALPIDDVVSGAREILGDNTDQIAVTLERLITEDELVLEDFDGVPLVFSPDFVAAENSVTSIVKRLAAQPSGHPAVDLDQAIARFEDSRKMRLGDEQRQAVTMAVQSRVCIITGGPGVGKTTIVNAILRILGAKGVKPVLCAPTGRAARRLSESTDVEASTIHRLLEYQPNGGFVRGEANRLEGQLFVVDEASMIDIRLMAGFLEALPDDVHLILVGDVDQLPSVGPGTVLRDLIESETIPVSRLTEIFRQAQLSQIVRVAHQVNVGEWPEMNNDPESDLFFIDRNGPDAIGRTLVQLITERIPRKFGFDQRDGIQVLTPMNRNALGTRLLNKMLQDAINPPHDFKFEIERFGTVYRRGDKVIQTKNNYDNEVFNGDIGYITEITPEPSRIIVQFDGKREVSYEPGDLDELKLAYAITIHKSQGSEFPAVVIPLASEQFILLQRNLIYTGITRGKKLVILVGEKKALQLAIRNQESRRRWTGLKWRLVGRG